MRRHVREKEKNYDDIIHLPRHVSRKRPQMPLEDRAAQFSPFAAVVGHEASVKEAARVTDEKRELDEAEKTVINEQLREVQVKMEGGVQVEIEHFQADPLKAGGQYIVSAGVVKKIDVYTGHIHLSDGTAIAIEDIVRVVMI